MNNFMLMVISFSNTPSLLTTFSLKNLPPFQEGCPYPKLGITLFRCAPFHREVGNAQKKSIQMSIPNLSFYLIDFDL